MRRDGYRAALLAAVLLPVVTASGCGSFWMGPPDPQDYIGDEPPMVLLVAEYHGPQSQELAEEAQAKLKDNGLKKGFVIADEDEAYLCYGKYKDFEDKSYKKDKTAIDEVTDASGRRIFGRPTAALLPETTPATPYDLLKAPGEFTVQIGTFDLYGRKHAANEFAEKLRGDGWKAYVYHGETQSLVTIDSFDRRIFDNQYRMKSTLDPARIISPDVKRILAAFPYLNWNGHQFTEEQLSDMKYRREIKVWDPRTRRAKNIVVDRGALFKSKLVFIPEREGPRPLIPPRTPAGPMPSPRGTR